VGAGQLPDPYVLNSQGNCHASLGAGASMAGQGHGGAGACAGLQGGVCSPGALQCACVVLGKEACMSRVALHAGAADISSVWRTAQQHKCSGHHSPAAGEWRAARDSFLASADGFQRASGFRYGRSTTPRLDGAVYAASNAGELRAGCAFGSLLPCSMAACSLAACSLLPAAGQWCSCRACTGAHALPLCAAAFPRCCIYPACAGCHMQL